MAGAREGGRIAAVVPGGLGAELGLEPGDRLLAIDGEPVRDWVDYRFRVAGEAVEIRVRKAGGEEWLLDVEKDYDDDLGLRFEDDLFDGLKRCHNACVFCFLHQMPKGLRPSLYLPDDDYRLSFLHGNFITLTNLREEDLRRIEAQRLSPLYVSVHATRPEVRRRLMSNRRAARVMEDLRRLAAAGIALHCQLVLCPGINDGAELDRSIADLAGLGEAVRSIAAVPVGLTRHREGLAPLRPFTPAEAGAVIAQVRGWRERLRGRFGRGIVHASDEFYVLAGREVPPAGDYDGFPQLENGVGLLRLFLDEFREALSARRARGARGRAASGRGALPRRLTVVTGRSAAPTLERLAREGGFGERARVFPVDNDFFGHTVTVAGLLTGGDIIAHLRAARDRGEDLGEAVLLPQVLVRDGDGRLLDDRTPEEIARAVGLPVRIVPANGRDFLKALA